MMFGGDVAIMTGIKKGVFSVSLNARHVPDVSPLIPLILIQYIESQSLGRQHENDL